MGGTADVTRLNAAREAFRSHFGRAPEGIAEAPGRVNLIGEHLDYNEGLVLPAAIDRSVLAAYASRGDDQVCLYAVDLREESALSLNRPIERDGELPWSNYPRGVLSVLRGEGFSGAGIDIAVTGDVPVGAGLSSSAALEVATAGALRAAWGLDIDDERLARLCQRAENEFVGVGCGIMDQFASALGEEGCALLIDCRSLGHESIPLWLEERGLALVVVESGVARRLEDSAYNQRREECAEAVRLLKTAMRERAVSALRDVTLDDLSNHNDKLPPVIYRRARHVVTELQRVIDAADALRHDDHAMFGTLMNSSHASLRDDFEVSCGELDRLVGLAQRQRGVLGARLTGAGFGGCTVQLVQRDALEAFGRDVVERYRTETGLDAKLHVCRAAGGLRVHEASA
jgi:galactokinase